MQEVETFEPEALISLTVPKMGVRQYKGRHWLGGRFVPGSVTRRSLTELTGSEMANKLELNLPEYEGVDQVVELPSAPGKAGH